MDTTRGYRGNVNAIGWLIFLHSENKARLLMAAGWMKRVVNEYPKDSHMIDTYACLLYKLGETEKAIELEKKNIELKSQTDYITSTIAKMQKGEAIWTEKEYQ